MDTKPDGTELLRAFNAHFERMQRIMVEYLPPDSGISQHDVLGDLIALLDGPEQRAIQRKVKRFLGQGEPAFFAPE